MQQVDQDLQAALDDGVGAPALDVGDEPDAAGVVLVARIVQAGRRGVLDGGRVAAQLSQLTARSKIE